MTERHYPDKLEIVPLKKPPHATIRVPGSKSITNRALVLAALSEPGECPELARRFRLRRLSHHGRRTSTPRI